ncbi:MAG: hypothetical protein AB7O97_05650 [Planctomycetota bacterium]
MEPTPRSQTVPGVVWLVFLALALSAIGYGIWAAAAGPRRTLLLDDDLAIELRFAEPVAAFVERRQEGGEFTPFGWATLGGDSGTVTLRMQSTATQTVRVTLGTGARLVDANGEVVGDSRRIGLSTARTDRPLRLDGAGTSAQLQTERGSRVIVTLRDGVLHSTAEAMTPK